jgi:hypothetical protein
MRYVNQADGKFHSWRVNDNKVESFCQVYEVEYKGRLDFAEFEGLHHKPPQDDLCYACFHSELWDDLERRRVAKRYG